jgi:RHS repeat-associated protein
VLQPVQQPYNIAPDHLGAPHQITNAQGHVVWQWDHDPFGNGLPTGSLEYNLRFPGQVYDQNAKLHYNYFRDYDPRTGRYIESDPIGLRGGIATYDYVRQNPLRFVDPKGENLFIVVGSMLGITALLTNYAYEVYLASHPELFLPARIPPTTPPASPAACSPTSPYGNTPSWLISAARRQSEMQEAYEPPEKIEFSTEKIEPLFTTTEPVETVP